MQPAKHTAMVSKPAPRRLPREGGSFVLIAGIFFTLVMVALSVLLLELHSIQGRAHDFVKAHARVGRVEEQLTSAVRAAAAANLPQLKKRYRELELELGNSLIAADDAAKGVGMDDYVARRDSAAGEHNIGQRLGDLEKRVFDLLDEGKLDQARTLALGDEHDDLKAAYLETIGAIDASIDQTLQAQLTIRYAAVFGLFLLLAAGTIQIARMGINRIKRQRDQILTLAEESKAAKDEAELASRAKGAFLATMSHEIRTPLTAIVGFGDVLLDASSSGEDRMNAAHTIRRNASHLLLLLNDILDMSKIEAGKLDVERIACSPIQILQDVEQMLAGKAVEKGLTYKTWSEDALPSQIISDPTRMKQALLNLVGNAIKFTSHGSVRVIASCDQKAETISFRIEDDGIGISEQQVQKLFSPFSQADNSMTRRFGGTGLGLYITRSITERLGGRLTLDSSPNVGSVFTLTLPMGEVSNITWAYLERRETSFATPQPSSDKPSTLAIPQQQPLPSAASAQSSTSSQNQVALKGRILLVEDGVDNQRLISLILRKAGATVEIAENGEVGLRMALEAWKSNTPYELILMDMQMPVMDGYTASNELRNQNYPFQILALTAHALKGEQQQCIDAGCDACLTKPINKPVFLADVAQRMGAVSSWKPLQMPQSSTDPMAHGKHGHIAA